MSSNYKKLQSQRAVKKLSSLEKRNNINKKFRRTLYIPCAALAVIIFYGISILNGTMESDKPTIMLLIFMVCAIAYYIPQIISSYKEKKLIYEETK